MSKMNGKTHFDDDYELRRYVQRERSMFVPFALGAVIGGIIGASVALLYAPAEGTELRRGLNDTLDDLVGGAKDIIRGVKSSADKIFNDGLADEHEQEESPLARTRERADDIIEDADRAIAEARRRTQSARSRSEEE